VNDPRGADPALAAPLLGLDDAALLRAEQGSADVSEGTILDALFEHLAALSVQTSADAAEARVDPSAYPQRWPRNRPASEAPANRADR
jgi:hypothetical protein